MADELERFPPRTNSLSTCCRAVITLIQSRSGGSCAGRSVAKFSRTVGSGYAASLDGYLRVVLLSDGETVHNVFLDEDYP